MDRCITTQFVVLTNHLYVFSVAIIYKYMAIVNTMLSMRCYVVLRNKFWPSWFRVHQMVLFVMEPYGANMFLFKSFKGDTKYFRRDTKNHILSLSKEVF